MQDTEKKVTVRLPQSHYEMMELLIALDDSNSVSEIIRTAVREYVYDRVVKVQNAREEAVKALGSLERLRDLKEKYLKT